MLKTNIDIYAFAWVSVSLCGLVNNYYLLYSGSLQVTSYLADKLTFLIAFLLLMLQFAQRQLVANCFGAHTALHYSSNRQHLVASHEWSDRSRLFRQVCTVCAIQIRALMQVLSIPRNHWSCLAGRLRCSLCWVARHIAISYSHVIRNLHRCFGCDWYCGNILLTPIFGEVARYLYAPMHFMHSIRISGKEGVVWCSLFFLGKKLVKGKHLNMCFGKMKLWFVWFTKRLNASFSPKVLHTIDTKPGAQKRQTWPLWKHLIIQV